MSKPGDKVVIQGLWVGDRLPVMQQLSVASFLANGHDFHLYAYSELANVPRGAVLKDAAEIIPQSEVFKNARFSTFAAFSDFFRYKLLLDRGGWWADVDMVCLRPFEFEDPFVFSSEHELALEQTNTGVIKAPPGSDVIAYAWESCNKKDKAKLAWDEVGPTLLREAVRKFGLQRFVRPAIAFCPLPSYLWKSVLSPSEQFRFQASTFAIHLWHELWRREDFDINATYAPGCLYEQLKAVYLFNQPNAQAKKPFQVLDGEGSRLHA